MRHYFAVATRGLVLLIFLIPAPAMADVIGPSIVDMICAPLPGTLGSMFFGAVVTVPTLLIISIIETLVVMRLSPGVRFGRVFCWLLFANAISSILGLVMWFRPANSIYPVWWEWILAYVLSAGAESPFLWLVIRRNAVGFRSALTLSFAANAASYAFLVIVVLSLTAIPMYRLDPTGLRKELRGQLFVYHHRHSLTLLDDLPAGRPVQIVTDEQPYTHGFYGSPGRMFLVDGEWHPWELKRTSNQWHVVSQSTPVMGRLLAVGTDGETLICGLTNQVVLAGKQGTPKEISGILGVPIRAALSRDGRYLVYTAEDVGLLELETRDPSDGQQKSRWRMPPQVIQDAGNLHIMDLVEGTSSFWGRLRGNQFGFHPSKNLLAVVGEEGIEILDLDTKGRNVIRSERLHRVISNLAWSPDGKYLAFLQYHGPHWLVSRGFDSSLWIFTVDGNRFAPLPVAFSSSGSARWNIVWRND